MKLWSCYNSKPTFWQNTAYLTIPQIDTRDPKYELKSVNELISIACVIQPTGNKPIIRYDQTKFYSNAVAPMCESVLPVETLVDSLNEGVC